MTHREIDLVLVQVGGSLRVRVSQVQDPVGIQTDDGKVLRSELLLQRDQVEE